jgi:phage terminase small subunit
MGKSNMAIDPRERRFVELYCQSGNKVQSYIVAGFTKNYGSAAVQAHRLLQRPKIAAAVEKRSAELAALYGFNQDRIFREIAAIALMPVEQLELKGADKVKALELLAKLNRMFPGDRLEISGPGGGPIETAVAHKIDIASLDPEARQKLKEALVALKAKQIDQEPARD